MRRVVIAAASRKEKVREGRNQIKNLLKSPITLRASQNSKLMSSVKTY